MIYAPKTGIKLPGTSGNYISTPDHPDLTPSSSLDLRFRGKLTNWHSSSYIHTFVAKRQNNSNNFGYQFYTTETTLTLGRGTSASTAEFIDASELLPFSSGQVGSVRVLWDCDADTIIFYTSIDGIIWDQLGEIKSANSAAPINDTNTLNIGGFAVAPVHFLYGIVLSSEVYVDGTLVAEFNAAKCKPRYRDSTGKIWTLNGSDSTMEKI